MGADVAFVVRFQLARQPAWMGRVPDIVNPAIATHIINNAELARAR